MSTYDADQTLLYLSAISYVGRNLCGMSPQTAQRLHNELRAALQRDAAIAGRWEIVWGPAIAKPWPSLYHSNVMFVVREADAPGRLVVVVRGTSTRSLMNWLFENIWVAETIPWPFGAPRAGRKPHLSQGAALGLALLQGMRPAAGVPGAGHTLLEQLRQEVAASDRLIELTTTGHSLGGALAVGLAVWLSDLRGQSTPEPWDPQQRATITACTFAGPTLGDADFADHADEQIGPRLRRLWCSLDVVPHAWQDDLLERIPGLYQPQIPDSRLMGAAVFSYKRVLPRHAGYRHVRNDQPPLAGRLNPEKGSYAAQMFYQHTNGYVDLLGLTGRLDLSRLILDLKV